MAEIGIANIGIGQTAAPLYPEVAYAGLIYGLDKLLVVSVPYKQTDTINPGIVLSYLADGSCALPSVAAAAGTVYPAGVFVRDATLTTIPDAWTAVPLANVLSVVSRGAVWVQVTPGATCTAEGPVHFDVNGMVSDTGAYTLPHASFLTVAIPISTGGPIAAVMLHSPLAA